MEDTMDPVNDEYGGPPKNKRRKKTSGDSVPTTTHQGPSSTSRIQKKKTGVSKPARSSKNIEYDIFRKEFNIENNPFLVHACMRVAALREVEPLIYGTLSKMQDMLDRLKSKLNEDRGPSVASYLDMQMRELNTHKSEVELKLGTTTILQRFLGHACIRGGVLVGEVTPLIDSAIKSMQNILGILKCKLDAHDNRGRSVAYYLETQRELLDSLWSGFKSKLDTEILECQPPPIA